MTGGTAYKKEPNSLRIANRFDPNRNRELNKHARAHTY